MAKSMRCAKPDLLFGLSGSSGNINVPQISSIKTDRYKFDFGLLTLLRLTTEDFEVVKCRLRGCSFSFPVLVLERESDGGNAYVARNQVFTCLLSVYEAQKLAQEKISPRLPILALGLCNVGDYFELYCMVQYEVRSFTTTF
jgi:hypothetical protein